MKIGEHSADTNLSNAADPEPDMTDTQSAATPQDFTAGQRVRTSMQYFDNLTGTVLETPEAGATTVAVQMDEATQWHDDESGGEIYTFEPQHLTVIDAQRAG
jgi:hypothetical protein